MDGQGPHNWVLLIHGLFKRDHSVPWVSRCIEPYQRPQVYIKAIEDYYKKSHLRKCGPNCHK